jgi:hypothetical protein
MIPQECGSGHDATIIRKRNAMRYTNMKAQWIALYKYESAATALYKSVWQGCHYNLKAPEAALYKYESAATALYK